jgi:5-methylcytosine-specific restriction endonuclease McrA
MSFNGPIKKQGAKKSKPVNKGLAQARNEVFVRSKGLCEAKLERCTVKASHAHHMLMRSQGGKHDVSNLLAVCSECHSYIHLNPAIAYERGFLVRSKD